MKCTKKIKLKLRTTKQSSSTDLYEENLRLRGQIEALKSNPPMVTNNNNIIIFPEAYGNEKIEHIQAIGDFMKNVLKHNPFGSIPVLFNKIHNNERYPEYHNVYLSSERSSYALVSDGKSFVHRPKKTIIDQIIEDKRSILNDYIDNNGEQLGEKVLKKYDRYQEQLDDDSEFRKALELEIGGLLLDMKSVIANDDKTMTLLNKVNEGKFDLPV
jgi:hypothetical protein